MKDLGEKLNLLTRQRRQLETMLHENVGETLFHVLELIDQPHQVGGGRHHQMSTKESLAL